MNGVNYGLGYKSIGVAGVRIVGSLRSLMTRCFDFVYKSGILTRKERRTAVVRVHGNALKHGLTSEEVAYAWENPIRCRQRNGTDDPPLWISVGSLPDGRFAELIGFMDIDGVWCVFHAMVPPTKKFKRELGWR